jgi:hypothetical protein
MQLYRERSQTLSRYILKEEKVMLEIEEGKEPNIVQKLFDNISIYFLTGYILLKDFISDLHSFNKPSQ